MKSKINNRQVADRQLIGSATAKGGFTNEKSICNKFND